MIQKYRRKLVFWMVLLLIVFAAVFLIALFGLKNNNQLFNTALELKENWIVMILSVLSMIKVVEELTRI